MKIYDFQGHCDGDIAHVSAHFQADYGCTVSTLSYRFTGLPLCPTGIPDAAAISLFPLCLKRGEELDVRDTLTTLIARKLDLLQGRIADRPPFRGPIAIKATGFDPRKIERVRDGTLAHCCFDGASGIALDDDPAITHLLLVRGFDRILDDDVLWIHAKRRHEAAARHFGRTLITCETNLPQIAGSAPQDSYWQDCLQGAAAAAITRLLGCMIGRVAIAGGSANYERTLDPATAAARYVTSSRLH